MIEIAVKVDVLRRPSRTWTALFAGYGDLLARLRALGVDAVEASLTTVGDRKIDGATLDALVEWYRPWAEAGIKLHVHPYTDGLSNPAHFQAGLCETPLRALAQVVERVSPLAGEGRRLKLVYHAAEATAADLGVDPEPVRGEFLARSRAFFAAAWAHCAQAGANVVLVTETQCPIKPGERIVRIGDRPEEIEALAGSRPESVCWDTGHYLLSVERYGSTWEPAFPANVAHMHVHDVAGGLDHRPLTERSSGVARFVGRAAAAGKLSSVTLEYDYARALPDPSALDPGALLAHIGEAAALVRTWSGSSQAARSPQAQTTHTDAPRTHPPKKEAV